MSDPSQQPGSIELAVEGVGGIDEATVTLERGVNLLVGENATNRTSLLQAIMAGLGSDRATLKGDRSSGAVELSIDGEPVHRTIDRGKNGVTFGGDPYLADPTKAELFACLLESNPIRQTIARTDANREQRLRELLMRPVDTAAIDRQIRQLRGERDDLDERIARLETEREQLDELRARKEAIEADLAEAREELEARRAELAEANGDPEAAADDQERLEELLAEARELRDERESVRHRLETEREAIVSEREELETVRAEHADLEAIGENRREDLTERIGTLREQKRQVDARVSRLHRLVQFNEEMLDEDGPLDGLFDDANDDLTAELLEDAGQTTCWTCGSAVETASIEGMLDRLRTLSQEQRQQRTSIEEQLEELTEERDRLEKRQDRRSTLGDRIERLEATVAERQDTIATLEDRISQLESEIEDVEASAEAIEGDRQSRLLEVHRAVNEQAVRVDRLERERGDLANEIDRLESHVEEIDDCEAQRDQIAEQLTELRTRVERLEAEAIEAFNEHVADLLERLEYTNITRIWIERRAVEDDGRGRPPTSPAGVTETSGRFELHVVRETEDGAAYEDTVDHLSESEREVVGLVFALAGYLVHEVYEDVPVMLLDSLEAIDAERIGTLIEYLDTFVPTIVGALLPEDAAALDASYHRITSI